MHHHRIKFYRYRPLIRKVCPCLKVLTPSLEK